MRREGEGERAGAATGIERPLVSAERPEQPGDSLCQLACALLLQGDSLLDADVHPTTTRAARGAPVFTPHTIS